ncbi:MAG: hypothetical protein AB8I08_39130 [Sandaracinaceae bacterium]
MAPSISWTDPAVLRRLLVDAARVEPPPPPIVLELSPTVSPEPEPEFELTAGTIEERVSSLIDWLARSRSLEGLFITDANGLAIANRGVESDQVAVCATLMGALSDVRKSLATDARRMAIAIGDGSVLHLVAVETPLGAFGVGMVSSDFLSDDFMARAQRALSLTLGENNDAQ